MKLKSNQLNLIKHLCQLGTLDYQSCLYFLNSDDKIKASYTFRPLTKNKYISKHENGNVTVLAKGRALFPNTELFVTSGGGNNNRVNSISKTAMFLSKAEIEITDSPYSAKYRCFVPSTCWRRIRHGILSTTRFTGILFFAEHRLAVYDIGDGKMDWQLRAEKSLFYSHFGEENKTFATGMLFICDEDKRIDIAKRIIRETMWQRKRLIEDEVYDERDRPLKYCRTPIRVAGRYERVYLTTQSGIGETLDLILEEETRIKNNRKKSDWDSVVDDRSDGDFCVKNHYAFMNFATDLLKYIYFFIAAKNTSREHSIFIPARDKPIAEMYPKIMQEVNIYDYQCTQNSVSN